MPDIVKLIGERIRQIRKKRGFSQEQLAERASLHPNYIGQIERGEKNLTMETLHKITKGFGMTLEEFFRHLEPANHYTDSLSELIQLLSNRSTDDHTLALNLFQAVLNWEKNKKDD
ncbi:HTH-type transcriptional regulator PuuR [compost metagenome]